MNTLSILAAPALVAIASLALSGCGATAKPKAEARPIHNPMEITPDADLRKQLRIGRHNASRLAQRSGFRDG